MNLKAHCYLAPVLSVWKCPWMGNLGKKREGSGDEESRPCVSRIFPSPQNASVTQELCFSPHAALTPSPGLLFCTLASLNPVFPEMVKDPCIDVAIKCNDAPMRQKDLGICQHRGHVSQLSLTGEPCCPVLRETIHGQSDGLIIQPQIKGVDFEITTAKRVNGRAFGFSTWLPTLPRVLGTLLLPPFSPEPILAPALSHYLNGILTSNTFSSQEF